VVTDLTDYGVTDPIAGPATGRRDRRLRPGHRPRRSLGIGTI